MNYRISLRKFYVGCSRRGRKLFKGHNCLPFKMRIEFDKEADVAYIYIQQEIGEGEVARTIEVNESIILDFDASGKLMGIEILNAKKNLTKDILNSIVQSK